MGSEFPGTLKSSSMEHPCGVLLHSLFLLLPIRILYILGLFFIQFTPT